MSLLDKFANVEIKADNRISEEDRAFCLREQEAFDKSYVALQKIADAMASAIAEQRSVLMANADSFFNCYLTTNGFQCDPNMIYRTMKERNDRLIDRIVNHFAATYSVRLDSYEIKKHLIPEKPEDRVSRYGWNNMTDEQQQEVDRAIDEQERRAQEYERTLRNLPLRYEQIVDEIITQLGGFSFQERAISELLENCWKASHHENWHTHNTVEDFEIKKDVLCLKNSGCWCHCDDQYSWGPEWKPGDSLKILLNALGHYECKRMNEGRLWFPGIYCYSTRESFFEFYHPHVASIKLFKNGRVDIRFRKPAYVQEFVENYLRKNAGGIAV